MDSIDSTITTETSQKEEKREERSSAIARFSYILLLGLSFLIPVFFIPSSFVSLQFSKIILIALTTAVALTLWIVDRLRGGRLQVPKSKILLAGLLLPVAYLLSSLFSGSPFTSLVGNSFEFGTFASILALLILMVLVATYFNSKERIFYLYLAFFASFLVNALYQGARVLLGPDVLSFGIFTTTIANLVGKWYDLGAFFGLATILSMVTLQFLSVSRLLKVLLYVGFVLSLAFLSLINFYAVWAILAVFSLVFFVYIVSYNRDDFAFQKGSGLKEKGSTMVRGMLQSKNVSFLPIVTLLLSLFFMFAGGPLGDYLSTKFNVYYVEVRPSWTSTYDIAKATLKEHALFGVGPNKFVNQWLLNKPVEVNQNIFWNTDFNNGIGILPSTVVTVGLLGALAWLLFLGLLFVKIFRVLLSPPQDPFIRYLLISSGIASLYLWVIAFLYVPTIVNIAFAFIFTGIFISGLLQAKLIKYASIPFLDNPRVNFVSVLILILLVIVSVTGGYLVVQKFVASIYFQKSLRAANVEGNLDKAGVFATSAIGFSNDDSYHRLLSELYLAKANQILNNSSLSPEVARDQFQGSLGQAIENARQATLIDPSNYQNWGSLGTVYEAVVPLGITGAYENAKASYLKALALNPHGPAIYLTLARLELSHKDEKAARGYITQALAEKSNYTDAVFLLSQIEVQNNNIKSAITALESAALFSPNDATVYFQLGFLKYNNKDWNGAITALERAVGLNTTYSNARYFLGLAYNQVGRRADAIVQFVEIQKYNPDNQEVKNILTNLRAGRSPFANVTPPLDDKPEKRSTPPIKERTEADQNQ